MNIGLDILGGDFAPDAALEGAILAAKELSTENQIVLIGDEDYAKSFLRKNNYSFDGFSFIHAPDIIEMDESPTRAFTQKPMASISVGFDAMKTGAIDSFASAGNSGAMLVGAINKIGLINNILRPATTALIPKYAGGYNLLIDIGIVVDAKPETLYQFALLGNTYMKTIFQKDKARVGLLNIGEEPGKGNKVVRDTYKLLSQSVDFDFVGNVEGRDVFDDKTDIIVCDGFIGNIVLKQVESVYHISLKRGVKDEFFERLNYEIHGGTPILGVKKPVILGHGISSSLAFKNMILLSENVNKNQLIQKIENANANSMLQHLN